MYAIAIGDNVLQEEIDCITGGDRESVFNVQNFEQFFQLTKSINEENITSCQEICRVRSFGWEAYASMLNSSLFLMT